MNDEERTELVEGRVADVSTERGRKLRAMLADPSLSFLMEAHDGLSAKVVESEGFEGIWASGFSISTALGLRDSNEASVSQVLTVVEYMLEACAIPVVMDGDTGFGNFNNARRLARKLCQLGAAGVCIEDKLFPKTNSFIVGQHPLADVAEFCGRIQACKDHQLNDEFVMVARTEGFIAGRPLDEVLARADAYVEAGADAILVHSRQTDAHEVLGFAAAWDRPVPIVVSPTTYFRVEADVLEEAGISLAIWANQNMRAALTGMRKLCREVREARSAARIEPELVSLDTVFEFMGYQELTKAEQQYVAGPPPT